MTPPLVVHLNIIRSAADELYLEAERFEKESGLVPVAAPLSPDDTLPPEPAGATIPAPPDTDPAPSSVVRAGEARVAVLAALANVASSLGRLEAVTIGIARALDASKPETP